MAKREAKLVTFKWAVSDKSGIAPDLRAEMNGSAEFAAYGSFVTVRNNANLKECLQFGPSLSDPNLIQQHVEKWWSEHIVPNVKVTPEGFTGTIFLPSATFPLTWPTTPTMPTAGSAAAVAPKGIPAGMSVEVFASLDPSVQKALLGIK